MPSLHGMISFANSLFNVKVKVSVLFFSPFGSLPKEMEENVSLPPSAHSLLLQADDLAEGTSR